MNLNINNSLKNTIETLKEMNERLSNVKETNDFNQKLLIEQIQNVNKVNKYYKNACFLILFAISVIFIHWLAMLRSEGECKHIGILLTKKYQNSKRNKCATMPATITADAIARTNICKNMFEYATYVPYNVQYHFSVLSKTFHFC